MRRGANIYDILLLQSDRNKAFEQLTFTHTHTLKKNTIRSITELDDSRGYFPKSVSATKIHQPCFQTEYFPLIQSHRPPIGAA